MSVTKRHYGEPIKLLVDVPGYSNGRLVTFEIWRKKNGKEEKIDEINDGVTRGEKAIGQWSAQLGKRKEVMSLKDNVKEEISEEEYYFIAKIDNKEIKSTNLTFLYPLQISLFNEEGTSLGSVEFTITFSDGSNRKGTLKDGYINFNDVPNGAFEIELEGYDFILEEEGMESPDLKFASKAKGTTAEAFSFKSTACLQKNIIEWLGFLTNVKIEDSLRVYDFFAENKAENIACTPGRGTPVLEDLSLSWEIRENLGAQPEKTNEQIHSAKNITDDRKKMRLGIITLHRGSLKDLATPLEAYEPFIKGLLLGEIYGNPYYFFNKKYLTSDGTHLFHLKPEDMKELLENVYDSTKKHFHWINKINDIMDQEKFTKIKAEYNKLVQQIQLNNRTAKMEKIQNTRISSILFNFFSPFSKEKLWVMSENDEYTRIVRTWQPIIDKVNEAKKDLEANCAFWSSRHRTDPSWNPGITSPDSPAADKNAFRILYKDPPGTDPETCEKALKKYLLLLFLRVNFDIPVKESFELKTASIGSFNIFVTVDKIDCDSKLAQIRIWMYNCMSKKSFGPYGELLEFKFSGMKNQHMWWNWVESHRW